MPEQRPINVYKDGVLVGVDGYIEVSDEQIRQEALAKEMNDTHALLLQALNNWATLTLAQRDQILKHLVRYRLWKEGQL